MNIIFLDIDGPIIPGRCYHLINPSGDKVRGNRQGDPVAIGMIFNACKLANAKIVISSVHRLHGYDEVMNVLKSSEWFDESVIHDDWRIDLPIGDRADLIQKWLDEHPEIEKYVCIDDEILTPRDEDPHNHPLIKVTFDDGFLYEDFINTLAILGHDWYGNPIEDTDEFLNVSLNRKRTQDAR